MQLQRRAYLQPIQEEVLYYLFFAKPDVSYYGGSKEAYIQVCEPNGVRALRARRMHRRG